MKMKRFAVIMAFVVLMTAAFTGCGGEKGIDPAASDQAYMDFLDGLSTVKTAEIFKADDAEYNYDGIAYGEYSFEELKAYVETENAHKSNAKYSLTDFTGDGVNEMVLCFEGQDPSTMSWACIIKYNGESLDLNYGYSYGYRSYGTINTAGYVLCGGSMGAGAYTSTVTSIDENGFGKELFRNDGYRGSFATSIAYGLNSTSFDLSRNYDEDMAGSMVNILTYVADGTMKIAADEYSEDPTIKAIEDELVNELVSLGAELIPMDEMYALTDTKAYEGEDLVYTYLEGGETEGDDGSEEIPVLTIDFASDALLSDPLSYVHYVANESEYQVDLAISTTATIKDLSILEVSMIDVDENGVPTFSQNELSKLSELAPDKPLVLTMTFLGDTANMGLSYVDNAGSTHFYTIGMSGMDGSVYLNEEQAAQ